MSFQWNAAFETGIESVDTQHHDLVNLINQIAPSLSGTGSLDPALRDSLLDRLFNYAAAHFKAEELMMRGRGIDARHLSLHCAEHAYFSDKLIEFRSLLEGDINNAIGPSLLSFLIHWLSAHVLNVDQSMATQIAHIDAGMRAEVAYEKVLSEPPEDVSRIALIDALISIYRALEEHRVIGASREASSGFDQMTGLSDRNRFLDSLKQLTKNALAEKQAVALVLIDVDALATINRNFGHQTADLILQGIAERLRHISRKQDLLARTGDDEFALALSGNGNSDDLRDAALRLFQKTAQAANLEETECEYSLSAGIALLPDDAIDAEQLLAAAELALTAAKREGGGGCLFYQPDFGAPGTSRSNAIHALRHAIGSDQLVLHYQPQISLHSGEIVGLEALVRWNHPERGMVPPNEFIPLAEETGLVIPLGEWVIRTAIQQMHTWREASLPTVRVAVNISARHFRQANLPSLIEATLAKYEVSAHDFELELTESVMVQDVASSIRIADKLKEQGLHLSLDDFGTGYSSLAYLSRFAIDIIKIDQSFVRDITTNTTNASIAVATIAMAHKLGKLVVAEGVETEGQMHFLRRNNCDLMQGYLFSKPLPADAIADMLRQGTRQKLGKEAETEQPCLLLVDDEPNILNSLRRLLRREGYRILIAESGAQGLEILATNPVQVILSDQRMPEMTGSEFLGRVKALYPKTVRMVLSGYSDLSAVTDAINLGAIYKYLSKPWEEETLKAEIRHAFWHYRETSDDNAKQ